IPPVNNQPRPMLTGRASAEAGVRAGLLSAGHPQPQSLPPGSSPALCPRPVHLLLRAVPPGPVPLPSLPTGFCTMLFIEGCLAPSPPLFSKTPTLSCLTHGDG
ncbi:hypothetical protein H1C71_033053, partial [Ictidomys tridecemlineatus]